MNKSENANNISVSRVKYPPSLREFALTLHFYLAKAYSYVREKFYNALPDPRTLRSWYSSIDGEPDFTNESFDVLKVKVVEAKEVGKQILVGVVIDEMGIKKGLHDFLMVQYADTLM